MCDQPASVIRLGVVFFSHIHSPNRNGRLLRSPDRLGPLLLKPYPFIIEELNLQWISSARACRTNSPKSSLPLVAS